MSRTVLNLTKNQPSSVSKTIPAQAKTTESQEKTTEELSSKFHKVSTNIGDQEQFSMRTSLIFNNVRRVFNLLVPPTPTIVLLFYRDL